MNKNTEVLSAEYNNKLSVFTEIFEVINIEYAPLIINKEYKIDNSNLELILTEWFKGRGIPDFRDNLEILLKRLNVISSSVLLDKAYGLSLSDQYWLKPISEEIKYEDINFFDHDFDSTEFVEASFSNSSKTSFSEKSLKTPNNTTDGALKKSWIVENGTRYLLKSGFNNDVLQPFNEVLAFMISQKLGFKCVEYSLAILNNKVVSKCPCFINKDTELITARQILYKEKIHDEESEFDAYIRILEENGIKDTKEKITNMFLLDFLMLNEDRHMNNFGIIRDVNTLKWLDIAPIYDNGQSLNIIDFENEIIISNQGRFFHDLLNFNDILNCLNISKIDFNKLDNIVGEFDDLLHEYQNITHMSDNRIFKLCVILNHQIKKAKAYQNGTLY